MIQTYVKNDLRSIFLAASFTRFDSCSKKPGSYCLSPVLCVFMVKFSSNFN